MSYRFRHCDRRLYRDPHCADALCGVHTSKSSYESVPKVAMEPQGAGNQTSDGQGPRSAYSESGELSVSFFRQTANATQWRASRCQHMLPYPSVWTHSFDNGLGTSLRSPPMPACIL
eukprot:scaffold121_cov412-Prasinococcus_capsulatus_cf.AAC.13